MIDSMAKYSHAELSPFGKLLWDCYLDFKQRIEREEMRQVTLDEFAEWLEFPGTPQGKRLFSRQLISHYLNGRYVPTGERVDAIAQRTGPRVYDVLGLARPDPAIGRIIQLYDALPLELRRGLVEELVKQWAALAGWEETEE